MGKKQTSSLTGQNNFVLLIPNIIRFLFYALVVCTPLAMYSRTSELFEFNKMMVIYFLTIGIVGLTGIDILLTKRRIIHRAPFTVIILLFLLSQILSTVFSIDPHTSLVGYYGRFNGGLYSIIAYSALFFVAIQYRTRQFIQRLLLSSVLTSVVVIAWGLPGKLGYDLSCYLFTGSLNNACWTDQFRPAERMFSTLGQPNWLGAYLAIQLVIGSYFFVRALIKMQNKKILLSATYIIIVFCTILFTRSRSAFIASGFSLFLIFGYLLLIKNQFQNRIQLITPFVVALVIVLTVGIVKTGIASVDRFLKLPYTQNAALTEEIETSAPQKTLVTDSLDIRRIVWEGAIELGKRYPLFGTGIETFGYAYYFVRPSTHNLTSEWDFLYNKAHNEYLNYFATTGIFGIATYLGMIGVFLGYGLGIIIKYRTDTRPEIREHVIRTYFLLTAYSTILITNFVGFSTTTIQLFFYLIPALILFLPESSETTSLLNMKPMRRAAAGAIAAASLFALFLTARMYFADIAYAKGQTAASAGDYQEATEQYSQALSMHYEHVYEDKLSFALANLAYYAAIGGNEETAFRLEGLAQVYNAKTLSASRGNIIYMKTAMKNAYLFYQINQDEQYIVRTMPIFSAAELTAPTDPKIPYTKALFLSLLEDSATGEQKQAFSVESLETIDRAIELKPNYYDAYFLKAQLLRKQKKTDEARALYEYMLQQFDPEDTQILQELDML